MAPKPNSWKRKEGAAAAEEKAHEVEEEVAVEEMQDQNKATNNSKWENHQENSQEKQTSWGLKGANEEGDIRNENVTESAYKKMQEDNIATILPSSDKRTACEGGRENEQSLEVFILEDNIVNMQESMEVDDDTQLNNDTVLDKKGTNTSDPMVVPGKEAHQIQERIKSERLKKDTCLSTMEVERARIKKNLEGNSSTTNLFSVLSIDEIIHTTSEMGVVLDNNDFDTFNLLNDLENARNDLYQKQLDQKQKSQTDTVETEQKEGSTMQEESSEPEDFILVESRKKRRENRKNLKISPLKQGRRQDQEDPGLTKKRGRKPCIAPSSRNPRNKKKS
ncbi:uncharacterized protein [Miscanthus floridulus]|uniref:uncharacterized protein n=1 Tax=Miscanthus floridulus TaxID=154761 RepID=UPI00345AC3A1